MSFKEFFSERAQRLDVYDKKIVEFLRSSQAKEYKKNDYIYEVPLNVLEDLGIDEVVIEDLEVNSSGNDNFMVLYMPRDKQAVIYLNKNLRHI